MKCPSCGAEIVSGKFCEFCGSQISSDMLREQEIMNKQGCPKCGSTNTQIRRENQGEVRGKNSKTVLHQTVAVCKDCGYTWYPNGIQKPRKTWLWVLGWIFIFPLPLTLILLKKKDLKPVIKYGIIAIAWVFYLLIAFAGNTTDTKNDIKEMNDSVTMTDAKESLDNSNQESTINEAVTYRLVGEELGEYGKMVILNENTDLPVEKYLYKLPAGTYTVTTTNEKMASFFIVKDEIGIDEENTDYPEILQYVGQGYLLTAGENDYNGNAKKNVTVTLADDECFQLIGKDVFLFEKQ